MRRESAYLLVLLLVLLPWWWKLIWRLANKTNALISKNDQCMISFCEITTLSSTQLMRGYKLITKAKLTKPISICRWHFSTNSFTVTLLSELSNRIHNKWVVMMIILTAITNDLHIEILLRERERERDNFWISIHICYLLFPVTDQLNKSCN